MSLNARARISNFSFSPIVAQEAVNTTSFVRIILLSCKAQSCRVGTGLDDTDVSSTAVSGSKTLTPTADTTYHLRCDGPGGTTRESILLTSWRGLPRRPKD